MHSGTGRIVRVMMRPNPLKRLAQVPKHHLVDPALAARLLGATVDSLLRAESPYDMRREGALPWRSGCSGPDYG